MEKEKSLQNMVRDQKGKKTFVITPSAFTKVLGYFGNY